MTMSPATSPVHMPATAAAVPQIVTPTSEVCTFDVAIAIRTLAVALGVPEDRLKRTTRSSIGNRRYKVWTGAVVAVQAQTMAVVTSHAAILHAFASGGQMVRVEVPAQQVRVVDVGGVGIKVSVKVWTSAMCGPIRTSSPAAELAESRFGQLAVNKQGTWCTPISPSGKLICNRCGHRFLNSADLWAHGSVPARPVSLRYRLPHAPMMRGPPHHGSVW